MKRPEKNTWGTLTGVWVPHDTRDHIVDFVRHQHWHIDVSYLNIGGTF